MRKDAARNKGCRVGERKLKKDSRGWYKNASNRMYVFPKSKKKGDPNNIQTAHHILLLIRNIRRVIRNDSPAHRSRFLLDRGEDVHDIIYLVTGFGGGRELGGY